MNDTKCVRDFMQATSPDQVARSQGDNLGSERYRLLRARLVLSEALELCEALGVHLQYRRSDGYLATDADLDFEVAAPPDLVEIADACADLRYVVVGTEIAFGIPGDAVFAEVHRSNMTKLLPDGSCLTDEGGKVVKPDSYEPAQVDVVLHRSSQEALTPS